MEPTQTALTVSYSNCHYENSFYNWNRENFNSAHWCYNFIELLDENNVFDDDRLRWKRCNIEIRSRDLVGMVPASLHAVWARAGKKLQYISKTVLNNNSSFILMDRKTCSNRSNSVFFLSRLNLIKILHLWSFLNGRSWPQRFFPFDLLNPTTFSYIISYFIWWFADRNTNSPWKYYTSGFGVNNSKYLFKFSYCFSNIHRKFPYKMIQFTYNIKKWMH